MKVYKCIKRFMATPLNRYIPVDACICRWENIAKLVINNAPASDDLNIILYNGQEFDNPADVTWFYGLEPEGASNEWFVFVAEYPEDSCGDIITSGPQGPQGPQGEVGVTGFQGPTTSSVQKFYAYDDVGLHVIAFVDFSTWTDIPLDTNVVKDSAYTWTLDTAEITFEEQGWYEISYYISTNMSTGVNLSSAQSRLAEDTTGEGFVQIEGSLGQMNQAATGPGGSNVSVTILKEYNIGDKIKIQAQQTSGLGSTVYTVPDSVGLIITKFA